MTKIVPPPAAELIPETAPFSAEQRAWLNGFFAGYLDLNGASITPLSAEESAQLMAGVAPTARNPLGDNDDGEAPWHDPSLPMPDRMNLADGPAGLRPMRLQLRGLLQCPVPQK